MPLSRQDELAQHTTFEKAHLAMICSSELMSGPCDSADNVLRDSAVSNATDEAGVPKICAEAELKLCQTPTRLCLAFLEG